MDPHQQHRLTLLRDRIVEGAYLWADDDGAFMRQELAEYLKIGVGETLVPLGQGYHGASAARLFPVKGILRFPIPQQNDQSVFLSLSNAQWLYGADNMVTAVALLIDDVDQTSRIAGEIRSRISTEDRKSVV